MKLTLICDHGTRTVDVDDGREGIGSNDFARDRIAALMPNCPCCQALWTPKFMTVQP